MNYFAREIKTIHSSSVLIGSLNCVRAKPPLRAVLKIKLLGKGLTQEVSNNNNI